MGRTLFVTILLSLLFPPLFGQSQDSPYFEARADAREVLLNSYFEVTFTLFNGDGSNFRAPSFRDFVIVSGPSRSISTRIINGRVSRQMSYSYSLKPRLLGNFRIGSASIEAGNETLRTEPIPISVVKGKPAAESDGEFFIQAEPSTTEAYIGQQISLDYKLYTTIDIESYNVLEETDYPGFYAEDLKRHDGRVMREVIDGQQYTTKVLKRVALFPQQTGRLTIAPLQLQLGVIEEDGRRSNSFFFNRQIKRLLTQTEAVNIQVSPLPESRPETFTGAVGQFEWSVNLNPTALSTDDVLSLKLTIRGDGDIKRVLPPDIRFPDAFETYEPKILEESTIERGGRLISEKTIEYLALPKQAGDYEVNPSFAYFHPDSNRYILLDTQPYQLSVVAGSRPGVAPPIENAAAEPRDILFIKTDTALRRANRGFFGSPGFWVLSILPFFLLASVVVVRRYQRRRETLDPKLLRRRRARKVARQRLQQAEQYRQLNEPRAFYDEVSKAMLGYVGDKLQIPGSEMTKENVRARLQTLGVEEASIEQFLSVIQTCEMALFAGKDNPEAMQETYEKALEVIASSEASVKG